LTLQRYTLGIGVSASPAVGTAEHITPLACVLAGRDPIYRLSRRHPVPSSSVYLRSTVSFLFAFVSIARPCDWFTDSRSRLALDCTSARQPTLFLAPRTPRHITWTRSRDAHPRKQSIQPAHCISTTTRSLADRHTRPFTTTHVPEPFDREHRAKVCLVALERRA